MARHRQAPRALAADPSATLTVIAVILTNSAANYASLVAPSHWSQLIISDSAAWNLPLSQGLIGLFIASFVFHSDAAAAIPLALNSPGEVILTSTGYFHSMNFAQPVKHQSMLPRRACVQTDPRMPTFVQSISQYMVSIPSSATAPIAASFPSILFPHLTSLDLRQQNWSLQIRGGSQHPRRYLVSEGRR